MLLTIFGEFEHILVKFSKFSSGRGIQSNFFYFVSRVLRRYFGGTSRVLREYFGGTSGVLRRYFGGAALNVFSIDFTSICCLLH